MWRAARQPSSEIGAGRRATRASSSLHLLLFVVAVALPCAAVPVVGRGAPGYYGRLRAGHHRCKFAMSDSPASAYTADLRSRPTTPLLDRRAAKVAAVAAAPRTPTRRASTSTSSRCRASISTNTTHPPESSSIASAGHADRPRTRGGTELLLVASTLAGPWARWLEIRQYVCRMPESVP